MGGMLLLYMPQSSSRTASMGRMCSGHHELNMVHAHAVAGCLERQLITINGRRHWQVEFGSALGSAIANGCRQSISSIHRSVTVVWCRQDGRFA
jgi:hypothetical protein